MRYLIVIPILSLVSCDSNSRNSTSRAVGEALGAASNELVRTTDEVVRAAAEESKKRREKELGPQGTIEQQYQRRLMQNRVRDTQGFAGKVDGQGFPGHDK